MSLRVKLLLFFILIALIPLGLAGRSMITSVRDELKSAANDQIGSVADQVRQTLEDLYQFTWRAPVRLIAEAVQSPSLGVREKLALLTDGMKNVSDIVALQVAVEGMDQPLVVVQDDFANRVRANGGDPFALVTKSSAEIFPIDPTAVDRLKPIYAHSSGSWLVAVTVPLDDATFGRPAALLAIVNLERVGGQIARHPFSSLGVIHIVDSDGRELFTPERTDLSRRSAVAKAVKLIGGEASAVGVEPYTREDGVRVLGSFALPRFFPWAVIVEQSEGDAYFAVAKMTRHLIFWLGIGLLAAIGGAILLSVSLTRPLMRLTSAAGRLAGGDLDTAVAAGGRDEIGQLAAAFNKMVADLKRYIYELTETTKAKERAESELKLAREIQQSFLPTSFPSSPKFEVWGMCDPAREVGGDYFDVFPLDEGRLGIIIGDVSGKGVPAALFMAVSRTLFRMLAATGRPPGEVLTEFNDRLVAMDEGTHMFITVFYGILDIQAGAFIYSTAGHNMPFIGRVADGEFRMLPDMRTLVAGIMDGVAMPSARLVVKPGDILVLYTDGLVESINQAGEEYGEERFAQRLKSWAGRSPREICEAAIAELKDFQIALPQFDDMTMVALKVK